MPNGTTILKKEVADDINRMEEVEVPKNLEHFWSIVKPAIIRSLRLGETAGDIARGNRLLLLILIGLTLKTDVTKFISFAFKFFGG